MDSDDNWQHVGSPVASVLAGLEARTAHSRNVELLKAARATDNSALHKLAAQQLSAFEKHAEESQWWA